VLRVVPAFESGNQAVELADYLEQGLFSIADILEHLFPADAIVKIQVEERFSEIEIIGSIGMSRPPQFFSFQISDISGGNRVFLMTGHPQRLVI
jgi:hypothetical protein